MKKIGSVSLLVLLSVIGFAQPVFEKSKPKYVMLKNAFVIDMIGDKEKKGDILIKDDRIEEVSFKGDLSAPKGAVVYDLTGQYIMPGLIDNHVHITHGTFKEAREHLEIVLKAGVTSVRDMGGDGRMLTLLKKNMLIGEDQGADVYFSTIIAGPTFFKNDPRPQQVAKGAKAGEVSWQRAIMSSTDFKQIIAEAKGLGATAIKIYASVDRDLIKSVSDEAKRQGLKVWAHAAIPPTRPSDVIDGGVEVVSHAGDMIGYELASSSKDRHDFKSRKEAQEYRSNLAGMKWDTSMPRVRALFKKMKANNVILDATLHVYNVGLSFPWATSLDSAEYTGAIKVTNEAHKAGIKIGAGSDEMIGYNEFGEPVVNIHGEIALLTEAGLSNLEALKAATIINAEALGEKHNLGTIEKGKVANLVVLNANPLKKIENTRDVSLVVKRGKVLEK